MKRLLLLPLLALATAGCPILHSVSSAPPLTSGEFDYEQDTVELTKGVTIAISCRDPWSGGPCDDLEVTSDDPSIAKVKFVHLDKFRSKYGYVYDEDKQRSVFLIAGVSAGRTKVRIVSDDGDEVLDVSVAD